MKKVGRQIIVNWFIIALSGFVIYIGKSITQGTFAQWGDCYDSDFVFAMISALLGTIGWRYTEAISANIWDGICFLYLILLIVIYGASIALSNNNFIVTLINVATYCFIPFYAFENVVIIVHLKRHKNKNDDKKRFDYIGYNKC